MMDEAREKLLAEAANLWGPRDSGRGEELDRAVADIPGYLRAYYRRVDTEDLAPPARLAAVARTHAELGLTRPQGRALVQVADSPEGGTGLTVDIVTDDMQYLVDSVTTELNRHRADIYVIIHPLLRVRRDVTGGMRGIRGKNNGGAADPGQFDTEHDELAESWIHVEIGRPADRVSPQQLAADLRHVLEDVRVAVEDQSRMASTAAQLSASLVGETRSSAAAEGPGQSSAEAGRLLEWLAAGHFTFLGYREYDLIRGAEGLSLRAVPGSGLGILRHDRKGDLVVLNAEAQARAVDPDDRLVMAKANSRSTVYRANYLDYVSVKKLAADGSVSGEWRFLGLYTYSALAETVTQIPVLREKTTQVLADAGLSPESHDGKDLIEILETYPREELFEIPAAELTPIALGVLRLRERRQTRLFLRRDSYGR